LCSGFIAVGKTKIFPVVKSQDKKTMYVQSCKWLLDKK